MHKGFGINMARLYVGGVIWLLFVGLLSVFLYLCLDLSMLFWGESRMNPAKNTMEPRINPVKTGLHDLKKGCGNLFSVMQRTTWPEEMFSEFIRK